MMMIDDDGDDGGGGGGVDDDHAADGGDDDDARGADDDNDDKLNRSVKVEVTVPGTKDDESSTVVYVYEKSLPEDILKDKSRYSVSSHERRIVCILMSC